MSDGVLNDNATFLYVIVIVVGVAHLLFILFIVYKSCCENRETLRETQQSCDPLQPSPPLLWRVTDNVEHRDSLTDNSEHHDSLTANVSNDNISRESNTGRTPARPLTTWQSNLLARVRARLQMRREPRTQNSVTGQQTSHSGQSTQPVHSDQVTYSNYGTTFSEFSEVSLPSYQDSIVQQPIMFYNEDTGRYEFVKDTPPSYEEVMEGKS